MIKIFDTKKFMILAKIAPSVYPVVIGLRSIREHNLAMKCSFFRHSSSYEGDSRRPATIQNERCPQQHPGSHSNHLMVIASEQRKRYRKEDLLSPEPDEDFIPPEAEYDAPWEDKKLSEAETIDKITIEGSPELRRKIRDKCLAYANIFSCGLTPDPA